MVEVRVGRTATPIQPEICRYDELSLLSAVSAVTSPDDILAPFPATACTAVGIVDGGGVFIRDEGESSLPP